MNILGHLGSIGKSENWQRHFTTVFRGGILAKISVPSDGNSSKSGFFHRILLQKFSQCITLFFLVHTEEVRKILPTPGSSRIFRLQLGATGAATRGSVIAAGSIQSRKHGARPALRRLLVYRYRLRVPFQAETSQVPPKTPGGTALLRGQIRTGHPLWSAARNGARRPASRAPPSPRGGALGVILQ